MDFQPTTLHKRRVGKKSEAADQLPMDRPSHRQHDQVREFGQTDQRIKTGAHQTGYPHRQPRRQAGYYCRLQPILDPTQVKTTKSMNFVYSI